MGLVESVTIEWGSLLPHGHVFAYSWQALLDLPLHRGDEGSPQHSWVHPRVDNLRVKISSWCLRAAISKEIMFILNHVGLILWPEIGNSVSWGHRKNICRFSACIVANMWAPSPRG